MLHCMIPFGTPYTYIIHMYMDSVAQSTILEGRCPHPAMECDKHEIASSCALLMKPTLFFSFVNTTACERVRAQSRARATECHCRRGRHDGVLKKRTFFKSYSNRAIPTVRFEWTFCPFNGPCSPNAVMPSTGTFFFMPCKLLSSSSPTAMLSPPQ